MRTFGILAAAGTLILSVLAWIWMSSAGAALGLPPSGASQTMLDAALPLLGIAVAVATWSLVLLLRPRAEDKPAEGAEGAEGKAAEGADAALSSGSTPQSTAAAAVERGKRRGLDRAALVLGSAITLTGVLLVIAVVRFQINPVSAALVMICGTLALFAGTHALEGLARGDAIEINTHWGGLGGSLGGWRLSPITTLLALALLFLGATMAAGGGDDRRAATGQSAAGSGDNRTAANAQQPSGLAL